MLKSNKSAFGFAAALLLGTWVSSGQVSAANNSNVIDPNEGITSTSQQKGHIVILPGGDSLYVNEAGAAVSGTKSYTNANQYLDDQVNAERLNNRGGRLTNLGNNNSGSGNASDVSPIEVNRGNQRPTNTDTTSINQ